MKSSGSRFFFFTFLLTIGVIVACKKKKEEDPITPISIPTGVSVDLTNVPYAKLSDYRFFAGNMKEQIPNTGVLPYEPATSLFTDYALKKRFIWMPAGSKGTYVSDHDLINLPVGTALIKTFYYNNVQPSGETKILETRIMIKKSTGWIFAEYVWNDAQTEAYLQID